MRRWILVILVAMLPATALAVEEPPQQVEFTSPTPLLAADGTLKAWGWSRRAMMTYNRDAIPANRLSRVKEWEHYTVMSPKFTVGVTIAQLGALAFGSVEIIDYTKNQLQSALFIDPQPKQQSIFPANAYGDTDLRSKENFVTLKFNDGRRRIAFNFRKTPTAPAFAGELELVNQTTDESIAIARPFDEPGQFFYENKIFGMPATGSVTVDEAAYRLSDGESFAIFDWGRGIWPRASQWFWGQAAGRIDGRIVAINLGHGYGDDSRGTANAILVDGKLSKLGNVACDFDPRDRMQPWSFASDDGRLQLTFQPNYHQQSKQEILIAAAELHKIHGTYSGTLIVDGKPINVTGLLGFAEHMHQKW